MKPKIWLKILKFIGAVLISFMVIASAFFTKRPPYIIAGIKIDNIEIKTADTDIENQVKKYTELPLKYLYKGKAVYISPKDINVSWDAKKTLKDLRDSTSFHFSMEPIYAPVKNSFDENKLSQMLKTALKNDLKEMSPAKIGIDGKNFKIIPEQEGLVLNENELINLTKNHLDRLSGEEMPVPMETIAPTITADELSIYFDHIASALSKPIDLKYNGFSFKFAPTDFLDAIFYEKEYGGTEQTGINIKIKINGPAIDKEFISKISEKIDKKPSAVKIYTTPEGHIAFEGSGEIGEEIDKAKLVGLLENTMESDTQAVKIPIIQTKPEMDISNNLRSLGVQELIGVGHTSFYRSPNNRANNIRVAVAKFNGVIIKPGEEFSFDKNLGRVDETTGYLKELVIKPEGTIPEYGGGICQVSTTMYRAAIYTGLPITARTAHSYAVTYYSQIGGHGLDATVYPPAPDLKFKNNTQGAILIQGYVDGMEAYFKFYGTSDGRSIEMDGPYLSKFKDPGPDETIKTKELPPGEKKQVEHAGKGFDTVWYRAISFANGTITKETISSSYRPTSNKTMVGMTPEELAQEEAKKPQIPQSPASTPAEFKD